jgi:phage tail-like protein
MANSSNETVLYPFTAFNFSVEISVAAIGGQLCSAAFSECDGLEMTMEAKTIREGGNNGAQIRLVGPRAYGQLTLKRGMTANFDLWEWFAAFLESPVRDMREDLRGDAHIVILAPDGRTERARFLAKRCLPVKLKAPPLNGKDGAVAIEELQLAYESLSLERT